MQSGEIMKKEICPRCGSMIKNNYCVKCGPANNFYVEKLTKNDKKTDLELFMKDSYKKAKYNNLIDEIRENNDPARMENPDNLDRPFS